MMFHDLYDVWRRGEPILSGGMQWNEGAPHGIDCFCSCVGQRLMTVLVGSSGLWSEKRQRNFWGKFPQPCLSPS